MRKLYITLALLQAFIWSAAYTIPSNFSLKDGIIQTLKSPWTYAVPTIIAVAIVINNSKQIPVTNAPKAIYPALRCALLSPLTIIGTFCTVIKNSYAEDTIPHIIFRKPYLTGAFCTLFYHAAEFFIGDDQSANNSLLFD